MNKQFIIIMALAAIMIVIYHMLADRLKGQKGIDSEEKRDIEELVKKLIPEGESYLSLFAWNEEGCGENRKLCFYAVAFKEWSCWLIPIHYEVHYTHSELTWEEPVCYNRDNLREVRYQSDRGKVTAVFYIIGQSEPVEFTVNARNTKFTRLCPVDISQKEEVEQLREFLPEFNKIRGDISK